MSPRLFLGYSHANNSSFSKNFRRVRKSLFKILFISSLALSVFSITSPAYAQIKFALLAPGNSNDEKSTLAASIPAPLMFIANEGQFDPSIKFELVDGIGFAAFTENAILIAIEKPGTNPPWVLEDMTSDGTSPTPMPPATTDGATSEPEFTVVEIQFEGVNPAPQIDGDNLLPAKISYFLGDDPTAWRTDVSAFSTIRYADFATGYDLEIDGSSGTWVWRLVAKGNSTSVNGPGSESESSAFMRLEGEEDLPDLALEVDGGDVGLDGENIVIETEAGNIALPLIEVPENKQPDKPSINGDTVESPYKGNGSEGTTTSSGNLTTSIGGKPLNGFLSWMSTHSYGSLVNMDPLLQPKYEGEKGELVFSSFLGGGLDDTCDDLTYDSNGNLYVTGRAPMIWIPEEGTSPNLGPRGNWDTFIAKIDTQRNLEYLTFIGGSRDDFSSGIAVDESGNVYVTGNTTSSDFPMSPTLPAYKGFHYNPYTFVTDMIVFKLSEGGDSILFATYLGESYNYEFGYDIVHIPGSGGVIYVTGFRDGPNTHNGILVGFNTTLGGNASVLSGKIIGNPYSHEQAHGIAVSPLDNTLWVVGQTAPLGGSGGFNPAPAGGYDVFIQHYSAASDPELLSTTFFGGNGADCEVAGSFRECGIAVDAAGNAYVTGNTVSSDLSTRYPEGGGFQEYGGVGDGFALKLHAEACEEGGGECLKIDYWRYIGGGSGDSANSIAVSAEGDVYIAGTTESSDFNHGSFPKELIPDTTCNWRDSFLLRLSPEGYISFFTYLGGTNTEQSGGVALFEEGGKAALAGGISGQGTGEFPLVDPVDSSKISEWEGFVSEFTVPAWEQTSIVVNSPTDWAMVLSLRPEFMWTPYTGADHYRVTVYRVEGEYEIQEGNSKKLIGVHIADPVKTNPDIVNTSNCVPIITGDMCFKWRERNLFDLSNSEGFELTSGEDVEHGGYAFTIEAYSSTDTLLAISDTEYFQIPSMGDTWKNYSSNHVICNQPGCWNATNIYWKAYDDLFYHWGEHFDIPPTMLKAIMLKETARYGAEIELGWEPNIEKYFPPHMAYGYEPGWDWIIHWFWDYYNNDEPLTDLLRRFYFMDVENMYFHPSYPDEPNLDAQFFHLDVEHGQFLTRFPSIYSGYKSEHPSTSSNCVLLYEAYRAGSVNPGIKDCSFPYDRTVPLEGDPDQRAITIYFYSWMQKYMKQYSVTGPGGNGAALGLLPGCGQYNSDDCKVNKPWMPAQYRLSASYGLSMLTYWDQYDMMKAGIPPEQLYDPIWGSAAIAVTLSQKRCVRKDDKRDLGMMTGTEPTPWGDDSNLNIGWAKVINAYNGSATYYHSVLKREDSVKPFSVFRPGDELPDPILEQQLYPSDQYNCGEPGTEGSVMDLALGNKMNMSAPLIAERSGQTVLFFSPQNTPQSGQILEENEFYFDGESFWAENVFLENASQPGIGSGVVRIYSDSSKTNMLWESPVFDSVFPASSFISGSLGLVGSNVLFSSWKVGLHSYRFYPITLTEGGFKTIQVQDEHGGMEDGFFSDRGGIFPFPDGTVSLGQISSEGQEETQFHVYGYDGNQYFLQRIISPSNSAGDEIPPFTEMQLDSQANEAGWWNTSVILNLTASDDQELLLIKVITDLENNGIIYSPKDNLSLPFSEGRWNLTYQAVDWAGNAEPLHNLEIRIDQTSPGISMLADGKIEIEAYYGAPVTIDLQAEDPTLVDGSQGSGIKIIEYALGEEGEWTEYLEPFTLEESGAYVIRYRATDLAGNISEEGETVIIIDQDPPDILFDITGCAEQEGYFACPIQIHLEAEDYELPDGFPGSGVDRIEYRQNDSEEWILYTADILLNSSGYHSLQFRSIDKAGNTNESDLLEIWLDLEPPISSATIIGEPVSEGQYSPGALVEIDAQDQVLSDGEAGSGLKYIEISLDAENNWQTYTDPIVFEQSGLHTIFFRAADLAGNVEETQQIEIEIVSDIEPPLIEVSADPLQLWPPNNKLIPVRVFGTAFDMGSGIQSIHIEVVDEYGECEPVIQDILPGEIIDGNWERTIELMASKKGDDQDGRKYTIIVTATDNLGNTVTKEIEVIVPHDQGN
jgi:hypothetical protein